MVGAEHRFGIVAHLADFRPLLPAEEDVVAGLPSGDFDRLGDGSRPQSPSRRAGRSAPHFLRFLLLGGDEDCRPHEKGIRLSGAWIAGVLDLEACRVLRDIGLNNCRFDTAPILNSAVIERLFLDGSPLPGLHAERLEARGGLYLRGAEVDGEVRLISATFGGNVECDGATFRAASGASFNAEGIEARRIHFRGARCTGPVILSGAELVADLDCAGITVQSPGERGDRRRRHRRRRQRRAPRRNGSTARSGCSPQGSAATSTAPARSSPTPARMACSSAEPRSRAPSSSAMGHRSTARWR